MTNPLLISRKENAGILRKICSEIGATPREISGDEWSLALFIKTDLKYVPVALRPRCFSIPGKGR